MNIREDRQLQFLLGLAMFAVGVFLFLTHVYASSSLLSNRLHIGGMTITSGVSVIPFIVGVVLMFCMPRKVWPRFVAGSGIGVIVIWMMLSMNLRVRRMSLALWLLVLVLVFGGGILMLRSLGRKK